MSATANVTKVDYYEVLSVQRDASDAEQTLDRRLNALDGTADDAAVDPVEEADELLGDVAAIVEEQDQQMVLQPADLPGTAGLALAALHLRPGGTQLLEHLLERRGTDPGQAAEARTPAQADSGQETRHRKGPLEEGVL